MSGGFFGRLKYFDAHPKTLEDFRIKTLTGAIISIICTASIVFLFLLEWKSYITIEVDQELFVDLTRNQKLTINLNMTLPRIPCNLLSVDATDISGEITHDVSKGLNKLSVDKNNNVINDMNLSTESTTTITITSSEESIGSKCLSCYGSENIELNIKCCNTCDDVRRGYKMKGWQFIPHNIDQCLKEFGRNQDLQAKFQSISEVENLLKNGEGCRLAGFITVNKIAGNIHISPGVSFEQNNNHYHNMANIPIEKLNTDHYFETFSFGDEYPNQLNPLELKSIKTSMPGPDNIKTESDEPDDFFQQLFSIGFMGMSNDEGKNSSSVNYRYFLKIVPTTYQYLNGSLVNNTYQYSVTRSAKVISQQIFGASQIPGVFVTYELSPIMIKYIERSKPFSHFLTSCCAIIGGLFSIAGMLDAFTFRYYNMFKKYQMNKLT